jgi:hypothetical protein
MTKRYAQAATVFFVYFHTGMLLHELGHYSAALSLGWDAQLTYIRVYIEGESISPAQYFAFKGAGPLVDVALSVLGVLGLKRCLAKERLDWALWISTALALTSLRWLKVALQGPGSDESELSELLGLPWYVLPAAMVVPAALVWVFTILTHTRLMTLGPLCFAILFAFLGFASWVGVVRPALLPKPA